METFVDIISDIGAQISKNKRCRVNQQTLPKILYIVERCQGKRTNCRKNGIICEEKEREACHWSIASRASRFVTEFHLLQTAFGICIVTFAPPATAEFSKMIFPLCFLAMDAATYRPIP